MVVGCRRPPSWVSRETDLLHQPKDLVDPQNSCKSEERTECMKLSSDLPMEHHDAHPTWTHIHTQ